MQKVLSTTQARSYFNFYRYNNVFYCEKYSIRKLLFMGWMISLELTDFISFYR